MCRDKSPIGQGNKASFQGKGGVWRSSLLPIHISKKPSRRLFGAGVSSFLAIEIVPG